MWWKSMEDIMYAWKFLVAYYKDARIELVAEKKTKHSGQMGVKQATGWCAYWLLWCYRCWVCSEQTCYKRRLRLLWWMGCCLCNKRQRWNDAGEELMQWWREFGILTPGWVSVAEEQLCRRLHIPGFWRQGRYYCILYARGKWHSNLL